MATTAFVREIQSFTSINCKEQQSSPSPPDTHPQSSELPKMAPAEHHPNAQHVTTTILELTNHDSNKSSPGFTSSDSNDMAAVYPYSALQQMQAVYGGGSMLQPTSSSPNLVLSKCTFCDYIPVSELDSKVHESVHFPFKCSTCAYVAKTEGRLKSHESKYHSPVPPSTWVGSQDGGASGKRPIAARDLKLKKRPVKCKLCDFVSNDKGGHYEHLREAHADPKLLKCDKCPFATHYKHHLEYHLRNHFGSKPYHCDRCNYSCVNKSMLNSHKKSHSNVYQFRCAECSYATKYCHSLKMHLIKYDHSPGETLNADGTVNRSAVIDVHGRRRGPKNKKKGVKRSNSKYPTSQPMDKALYPNYPSIPPLQPPPAVYLNPKVYNNFSGTVFYRPSAVDNSNCSLLPRQQPPQIPGRDITRCPYCNFYTDSGHAFTAHILTHVDPKNLYPFYMNSFKTNFVDPGNYFAPKDGKTSPPEALSKAPDGGASSPPTNGYSSDAYSSPRSNPDAYSGWMQTPPHSHDPESSALNLARPKTSTPAAETSAVRYESYETQADTDPALDLSVKSSSDRQRTNSSSPNTSQSSYTSSGANDQPVRPTRNRRKGKAFKLDCYMREEEVAIDFMQIPKLALEHPARRFEVPKTSQNSAVRSEIPTSMKQKRKVDKSEDFLYKKFALSPPKEEGSFHQPFFNTPFPSTFQNTANNNAHPLPSPSHSLTSHSSMTPSPDRGRGQDTRGSPRLASEPPAPGEDRPVPKVVIKIEPMDFESKPDSNVKRCYYCDLIFGDQEMFAMHNRYHSDGDPFTCGICGVKCYDRVTLYNHLLNTPHPNMDTEITVVGVVKH